MLRRIIRKLAILAVLAGVLSGLVPSMLAVRTAHADEASQQETSTALDRSSAPAPKRSEAAKPEPLASSDLQVRSAVVPSDALASGTAGTCLFVGHAAHGRERARLAVVPVRRLHQVRVV